MWWIKLILGRLLVGIVFTPVIGMSFVHYESEGGGWAGIKADLWSNAKLIVVLSSVGAVIALISAIKAIAKGEEH